MARKPPIDTEMLLKYRFWFLLSTYAPLILALVCFLFFGVRSAVEKKKKQIKDAETTLKTLPNPIRNLKWIDALTERNRRADVKKNEIWEKAWAAQAPLLTWPDGMADSPKGKPWGYKFNEETREAFALRLYETQLGEIPQLAQPEGSREDVVQFKGGDWRKIVHVVPSFVVPPEPEELWLAQEDLWLQKGILRAVRQANEQAGLMRREAPPKESKPAEPPASAPAKPEGKKENAGAAAAAGQAKGNAAKPAAPAAAPTPSGKANPDAGDTFVNHYWRLSVKIAPAGGGLAKLKGRLTNLTSRRQILPVHFRVTFTGVPLPEEFVVDGEPLEPLASCDAEKVLRAYPEGIESVSQAFTWRDAPVKRIDLISMEAQSCLNAQQPLITDPVLHTPSEDQTAQTTGSGLRLNRYLQVTPAVRRIPIGVILIADQRYLDDILAAFANSPLRININQIQWQHSTEVIKPPMARAKPTPGAAPDKPAAPPPPPPQARRSRGGRSSRGGEGADEGEHAGAEQAAAPSTPGSARGKLRGPLPEDEVIDQVQLVIYGIASLYNPYPPPAPPAAPTANAAPPAGK